LIETIEATYAAGLNAELWTKALAAITELIGGVGTTLEVIDRRTLLREMLAFPTSRRGTFRLVGDTDDR
jgi:hypothetical protein